MIIALVNRHTLLQQLHQLSRRCCWCLFLHVASTFCHTQSHKFWIGVVQYKDETVDVFLVVIFSDWYTASL